MDNQTVIIDDKTRSKDRLNNLFMDLEKAKTDPYNKPEILIAKRQPTTRSGSNYFTFHIVNEAGFLIDITMDIANVIGVKLNDKMGGTIYRTFGNMDMGFQTLYEMFSSLGYETWKDWQSRIRYRYI
tara:strand:- start:889 stop:1269 length:381 start_codon:yes stop_codon:yes gene_type:complete